MRHCFRAAESGVSDFPCGDGWPGEEAFSEVETRNVRDYVSAMDPAPLATFAMHSAANLLLYPYSYDYVRADNWQEQVREER